MHTSLEWVDLSYQAQFAVPAFDLHVRAPDLLRAAHERLGRQFSIRQSDMQIRDRTNISDVLVSIALGNWDGKVDVKPQGLSIELENIADWNELPECQNCIVLIEQIVRETLSISGSNDFVVNVHIMFDIRDKDKKASNFIASQMSFKKLFSVDNSILSQGLYLNVCGVDSDEWHGHIRMSSLDMSSPLLFLDSSVHYQPECTIKSVEERLNHFRKLLEDLLGQMELEISASSMKGIVEK